MGFGFPTLPNGDMQMAPLMPHERKLGPGWRTSADQPRYAFPKKAQQGGVASRPARTKESRKRPSEPRLLSRPTGRKLNARERRKARRMAERSFLRRNGLV